MKQQEAAAAAAAEEATVAAAKLEGEEDDQNNGDEMMLTEMEILNGLEDIVAVSGPGKEEDFKEAKIVKEHSKPMQQAKLAFNKPAKQPTITSTNQKSAQGVTTGDEESEGLEFIDPEAEKRAKLAEAAKERDEPRMIVING